MPLGKLMPFGSSPEMDENPGFGRFWANYPPQYRINKGGTRKAWYAMRLKRGDPLEAYILERLELLKKTKKWRDGYVPSPQKFILEERWEDYAETEPVSGPRQAESADCQHVPRCHNSHWHMITLAKERGDV